MKGSCLNYTLVDKLNLEVDTVPKSVSELQRQSSQQLNLKFTKTYKLNKKR